MKYNNFWDVTQYISIVPYNVTLQSFVLFKRHISSLRGQEANTEP
jgi:hypothetical protein